MDSNNIHLRNLSNNNFYPTKNWKWVIIFVNIIVFTQDGIHFILDGIIKSKDKININLFLFTSDKRMNTEAFNIKDTDWIPS